MLTLIIKRGTGKGYETDNSQKFKGPHGNSRMRFSFQQRRREEACRQGISGKAGPSNKRRNSEIF